MAGAALAGKIYKRHFDWAVRADDLIVGLKHFRRHLRHPCILVWDRSPTHQAKRVQDYLAAHPDIVVQWLPPYDPELNPEEYCHGNLKQRLKNEGLSTLQKSAVALIVGLPVCDADPTCC